jgi:hypothetical protein
VLGPEHPHSGKTSDSPARVLAQEILEKRAGGDRVHRNMLVFLAPDRARLAELRQAVREFLAWKSLEAEKATLNLDNFQTRQVETKRGQFDEAVSQRIGETFTWVLVPSQTASESTVTWEETRVSGTDPIAVRVAKKLRSDESLIIEYSGARLRMDLDRVPLWRGDHVGIRQLWSDYTQYLYLPRLRDSRVLLDAVRSGVALLTWNPDSFAYSSAFDEGTGRYSGLVGGQQTNVVLDAASVLVKPEIAQSQIGVEPPGGEEPGGEGQVHVGPRPGGEIGVDTDVVATLRRFHGTVSLDPLRLKRDIDEIADAIVQHLSGQLGSSVEVTLEIQAELPNGASEEVVRTVTENARTLKFNSHGFERD